MAATLYVRVCGHCCCNNSNIYSIHFFRCLRINNLFIAKTFRDIVCYLGK